MIINIFDEEWIISYSPVRGLYALKDRFGHRVLLSDSLEACEAAIAKENGWNRIVWEVL